MAVVWSAVASVTTAVTAGLVLVMAALLCVWRSRPERCSRLPANAAERLIDSSAQAHAGPVRRIPRASSLGIVEKPAKALLVGKHTLERCRAVLDHHERSMARVARAYAPPLLGVETIVKLPTETRLLRLLEFSTGIFEAVHDNDALTGGEQRLMQIAGLPALAGAFISVNRTLDALDNSAWRDKWADLLDQEISSATTFLRRTLDRSVAAVRSKTDAQNLPIIMALLLALRDPDSAAVDMFPNILALVQRAFTLVKTQEAGDLYPVSLPVWFDPFLLLRRKTEHDYAGKNPRDAWCLGFTDVDVTFLSDDSSASTEQCLRQCTLWNGLRHPNVLALESASFVGIPRIVHARGTTLDAFLRPSPSVSFMYLKWARQRQELTWTRLHEAALGLQYLHSRDVVFTALTIQDLFVVEMPRRREYDSVARKCQISCANVVSLRWPQDAVPEFKGDPKWLAPERLMGEPVSLAADVFSFGLCILQAVTGTADHPGFDPDGLVVGVDNADPSTPSSSDGSSAAAAKEQHARDLVRKMCAQDPTKRVSIEHVVSQLERLAKSERGGENPYASTAEGNAPSRVTIPSLMLRNGLRFVDAVALARATSDQGENHHLAPDLILLSRGILDRVDGIVRSIGYRQITSDAGELLADVVSRLNALLQPVSMVSSVSSSATLSLSSSGSAYQASVVARRNVLDIFRSLHRQLSRAIAAVEGLDQDSGQNAWRLMPNMNMGDPTDVDELVKNLVPGRPVGKDSCGIVPAQGVADAEEQLVILQFELHHHASSYTASVLAEIHATIEQLEQRVGSQPLPPWFLPAYEVEFDDLDAFAAGAFGSVSRGTWLDASVVVKKVFASGDGQGSDDKAARDVFEREASIWSSLKHKNVVQLYGACHLRGQRIFVCEFAPLGTLDAYLRRHRLARGSADKGANVWQLLYGVACGLEYLHSRGIAHGDLKCNNVLIAGDETPKLTDFGLSEAGQRGLSIDPEADSKAPGAVGAYRWKAPEVLRGEAGTSCQADVYSFGMLIVEAVTGDVPWGRSLPDAAVKFHVANGQLPSRPRRRALAVRSGIDAGVFEDEATGESFDDDQWALVLELCAFEASKRLPLHDASARLLQFALQRAHK